MFDHLPPSHSYVDMLNATEFTLLPNNIQTALHSSNGHLLMICLKGKEQLISEVPGELSSAETRQRVSWNMPH